MTNSIGYHYLSPWIKSKYRDQFPSIADTPRWFKPILRSDTGNGYELIKSGIDLEHLN